jgi:hypothetical protein
MPTSVTPTLSSSSGYLVDIRDQVSNLIRFIVMNPGGTSDLWEGKLISFRYLAARYEKNRDDLCHELQSAVASLLNTKFSDYSFEVDFTHRDYKEGVPDGRYGVIFKILITNGPSGRMNESALISGDITVNPVTNEINLKYGRSADTAELV